MLLVYFLVLAVAILTQSCRLEARHSGRRCTVRSVVAFHCQCFADIHSVSTAVDSSHVSGIGSGGGIQYGKGVCMYLRPIIQGAASATLVLGVLYIYIYIYILYNTYHILYTW